MRRKVTLLTLVATLVAAFWIVPVLLETRQASAQQPSSVEVGQVAPDDPTELALAVAPDLSGAEMEALQIRQLQMPALDLNQS